VLTDIFFLEAPEPMMLYLILDIANRFGNMRDRQWTLRNQTARQTAVVG